MTDLKCNFNKTGSSIYFELKIGDYFTIPGIENTIYLKVPTGTIIAYAGKTDLQGEIANIDDDAIIQKVRRMTIEVDL